VVTPAPTSTRRGSEDGVSQQSRWNLPPFMFRSEMADYSDLDDTIPGMLNYSQAEHFQRLTMGSIGYMRDESHKDVQRVLKGLSTLPCDQTTANDDTKLRHKLL